MLKDDRLHYDTEAEIIEKLALSNWNKGGVKEHFPEMTKWIFQHHHNWKSEGVDPLLSEELELKLLNDAAVVFFLEKNNLRPPGGPYP